MVIETARQDKRPPPQLAQASPWALALLAATGAMVLNLQSAALLEHCCAIWFFIAV